MPRKQISDQIIEAAHKFNKQMGYPPGLLRIAPNKYQQLLEELTGAAGQYYSLVRGPDLKPVEMFYGMKVRETSNMLGFVCLSGMVPIEKEIVEVFRNPTLPKFVKPPETRLLVPNLPIQTTPRECLQCEEMFPSESPEHRVCDRCKKLPEWRYGGGL